MNKHDWDNLEDPDFSQERFNDRRIRRERKKLGTRSVQALVAQPETAQHQQVKFEDPGLQLLYEDGKLEEILWRHQQGKEATVYVGRGPSGLVAAKIYTDIRLRSFRNDRMYREGRYIKEKRIERAIEGRSEFGISVQQALWIEEEFHQLHALHQAGVRVPLPIAKAAAVILMEFVGSEEGAAPRLAEAALEPSEAHLAFKQSVEQLALIVRAGRVHGDYSTFNLLWWGQQVWVIDFPQTVELGQNPFAEELLQRDVEGLCRTFSHLGIKANPAAVLREVRQLAER